MAGEYIAQIKGVYDFKVLPSSALYISRGQVIPKAQSALATAKTIDFSFKYKHYQIYASHKHTTEEGGSQDNQYTDLQSFINESRDNNDLNVLFIAIADGEYYKRKNGKAGLSRIENLRSKCTQSVKVGTIYELPSILSLL